MDGQVQQKVVVVVNLLALNSIAGQALAFCMWFVCFAAAFLFCRANGNRLDAALLVNVLVILAVAAATVLAQMALNPAV